MVILIWNDITSGCRSSNKTLLQVTSPLLASNNLDQLMKQNFSLSFQPSSWNKKTKVQKPSPIWGWLHHLRWASPRILRWKCEIIQPFYAFPKTTRDLSQVTVFRAISNWKAASKKLLIQWFGKILEFLTTFKPPKILLVRLWFAASHMRGFSTEDVSFRADICWILSTLQQCTSMFVVWTRSTVRASSLFDIRSHHSSPKICLSTKFEKSLPSAVQLSRYETTVT